MAVELENDIKWDYENSIRQMKLYRRYRHLDKQTELIAIIPKYYERFAGGYKQERIDVRLWSATRLLQCMRCGEITPTADKPNTKCVYCQHGNLRFTGIQDEKYQLAARSYKNRSSILRKEISLNT